MATPGHWSESSHLSCGSRCFTACHGVRPSALAGSRQTCSCASIGVVRCNADRTAYPYDALMADLRAHVIPATWQVVIYALLVKPPPNNPEIVSERREIALMEQDMKHLLMLANVTAYDHIMGRLDPTNVGWGKGCLTADASVQVLTAVQQARAAHRPLWLLMIDIKCSFSMIDREVLTIYELAAELPDEVLRLATAIFGGATDGTDCRYDSAAGLGGVFSNNTGTLMGDVLSPNMKAKISIDSVIRAIGMICRGVRLWGASDAEVLQAAFGDDWIGCFEEEGELRAAWCIWRSWAGNDLILLCLPSSGAPVARECIVAFCHKWQPGKPMTSYLNPSAAKKHGMWKIADRQFALCKRGHAAQTHAIRCTQGVEAAEIVRPCLGGQASACRRSLPSHSLKARPPPFPRLPCIELSAAEFGVRRGRPLARCRLAYPTVRLACA